MKQRSILCLYLLLPLFTATAQTLSFGVQGGVPFKPPLGQTTDKMPFVLGPTAEVSLWRGLSFSTGILFSRAGQRQDLYWYFRPDGNVATGFTTYRSNAVEVPLLAKYRFLSNTRNIRPFLSLGATVRRTSIHSTELTSVFGSTPIQPIDHSSAERETVKWNADPTAAAGIDFKAGRIHIEPEIRYSYWGSGKHTLVEKNQVQFLFGIRF